MPAIGTVSLDIKQYETMLKKIETLTEQTAQKAAGSVERVADRAEKSADKPKRALSGIGGEVNKAAGAMSALGGKIGSVFGSVGQLIESISSSAVSAWTFAISTIVEAAMKFYDGLTLSAEEKIAKLDAQLREARNRTSLLDSNNDQDQKYLTLLNDLATKEALTNTNKQIALDLIGKLSKRYGDLEISIDKTTGKILNLDKAQQKILVMQNNRKINTLTQEREIMLDKAVSTAQAGVQKAVPFNFMKMFGGDGSFGGNKAIEKILRSDRSVDDKIDAIREIRDGVKFEDAIKEYNAAIDQLFEIKKIDEEIRKLKDQNRFDDAAPMQKAYDKFRAQLKAQEEKEQKQQEQREDEEFARLLREAEEDLKTQEETQNAAERIKNHTENSANSLYQKALQSAGFAQEANSFAAIERAKMIKGSNLTDDEIAQIKKISELSSLSGATGAISLGGVMTDSLTARGGGGTAIMQSEKSINEIISNRMKENVKVVSQIKTELEKVHLSIKGDTLT